MKIYLSPSDQWSNIVADRAHSEAYHCKQIADAAKKYLYINGYTTKVGDNSEEGSYPNRAKESNSWDADLHVCIHTNAGGGSGTLMLAYPSSVNNKYVEAIYTEVANLTPTSDRGIQSRSNLYEINKTNCVCAYLEADFHDNATIENWIDANVDNLGKAIARGICKADGKTFKESSTSGSDSTATGTLYKVQTGAFKDKSNATNLANKLNNADINSFVYYDTSVSLYKVQSGAFASKYNADAQVKAIKAKGFDAFAYKAK